MRGVLELTRLYLVESVRRQVHLVTLFLGTLLLLLPNLFNTFGMTGFDRVTKDVGLTLVGLFAVGMALFLASTAVPGDVERRTLYPILARPVTRMQYLLGKFLGILAVLTSSLVILGSCLLLALALLGGGADPRIFLAVAMYLLEAAIVAAFCLFASTFCSPVLAGVLGATVYIVGGLSQTFIQFFLVGGGARASALIAEGLRSVLPHLEVFHLKDPVVHGEPVPGAYLASVALYGLAWIVLFLLLADWSFEGKDL